MKIRELIVQSEAGKGPGEREAGGFIYKTRIHFVYSGIYKVAFLLLFLKLLNVTN